MEKINFLLQFILEAGAISKFVLLWLSLMSIFSWTVIFAKIFQYSRVSRQLESLKLFLSQRKTASQLVSLANKGRKKVYKPFLQSCLGEFLNLRKTLGKNINEDEIMHLQRVANIEIFKVKKKYKKGLPLLAITSSSAPFIGLFGTVVGVTNTFREIALQKATSLAVVAPGISEALIATALGIFVAIPALIFYNYFADKLRSLLEDFEILSMEVLNVLKFSS